MASNIDINVPKIYAPYYNDSKPYQIWKGSRFSAKSWTKALFSLLHCRSEKYYRMIYARDSQKNVRASQYQLFQDIAAKFGFYSEFDFHSTTMKVTHKKTGNFLIGGSFEQPDTLRSIADPTDFWAEEPITRTFSINRDDFLDIVGSLRNSYGIPTKFHFTFNPIGMDNFIYADFFDPEKRIYPDEQVTALTANWYDNPFCPQSAKDFLEQLRRTNPARYEVDGMGLWGVPQNESPFFYAFDDEKHVIADDIYYDSKLPIYLAFDFNIDPMTCVVAQLVPGVFCNVLKAYKVNNCTISQLCTRIKSDFPSAVYRVTADPAGAARSAGYDSVNTTMHAIIRRELGIGINQMDKPLLNFSRQDAWTELRIAMNTVLQNHPNFKISSKYAADLINDLRKATTIKDSDKMHKTSGNTEYGMHLTDCFMYLIATYFNNYLKRKL